MGVLPTRAEAIAGLLASTFRSSRSVAAPIFCELRKVIGARKFMISVPLFGLKFLRRISRLRRRDIKSAALVCAMMSLASCSSLPLMAPSSSKIKLVTHNDLNPDASGRPSPVPIRVYLLSNADKLSRADYFQIIDHEKDVLGSDIITREEAIVRPGESQEIVLQGWREHAEVGVVVGYRDIERANWRVISPLPHSGELTVTLDARQASANVN
jgi:type VI secretion system protein VasD